ncbi:MAG: hypothetical protein QXS73_00745 [Desulfurococcaceae archaeon]
MPSASLNNYNVVELDDNIIRREALIESDLLHHSVIPDATDLLNSSKQ